MIKVLLRNNLLKCLLCYCFSCIERVDMMYESSNTFLGVLDRYNGITVHSTEEPCSDDKLQDKLTESIKKWSAEERRCIWFKVNIANSSWVNILAKNGFNFHHAGDSFVMMYKWLPKDSKSNLPPACHTNLGVGCIVLNDENQILVVMEQHLEFPHWKLPGGYVEKGEDIKVAAKREVKEETGIDTEFECMITFRHSHNMMFGNSDMYIVVQLKATSNIISKSEIEIKECKWMGIEEFLNHPNVHEFNSFLLKQAFDCKNRRVKFNLEKCNIIVNRDTTAMVVDDL